MSNTNVLLRIHTLNYGSQDNHNSNTSTSTKQINLLLIQIKPHLRRVFREPQRHSCSNALNGVFARLRMGRREILIALGRLTRISLCL